MDLKLTTRSQEAMSAAVRTASTDGHAQVEPARSERPRVEVFPGWLGRVARLDFRVYVNSTPRSLPSATPTR